MINAKVIVYDEVVRAKLLAAAPRILANNRALVTSVLEMAKPIVVAATPTGPGHFGYHGRDTVRIEVHSKGVRTIGHLRAKVQLFWREFGTRGGARHFTSRRHKVTILTAREAGMRGAFTGGGERAYMTAHKAMSGTRRFISFYYGGMARWWGLGKL